ncbi:flagellar hook protein FlgE [Halanaerobium praevalens]|uniref:Flagellar hook protein FlgE n=1 Tax=Halanaerobium praevalens (strain ATCC 33744 / DSM 2228 / GSL) TaxID=572479 RepID=E3DPN1_HALPG|nr:flagellar hook protein FlgE [Halanaerobium praevalens]ADO76706.1 flagellar hook-basal body protein [Halanaerobium praevalens DSM 2228]
MLRSMYAGVSGLNSHQQMMDVTGNNISNVNTVGFKSSRVTFKEMLSQTIRGASAPQENRAGTNPQQVGLGVGVGSIDSDMSSGNLQSTGKTSDVAIQGDGFFVLRDGSTEVYSRAGNFNFDEQGRLYSSSTGMLVQGWTANENGEYNNGLTRNNLGDIQLKQEINAEATDKVNFAKNLKANIINDLGIVQGSMQVSDGATTPVTDNINFSMEPVDGSHNVWEYTLKSDDPTTTFTDPTPTTTTGEYTGQIVLENDGSIDTASSDVDNLTVDINNSGNTDTLNFDDTIKLDKDGESLITNGTGESIDLSYQQTAKRDVSINVFDSQGGKHSVLLPIEKIDNNTWEIDETKLEIDGNTLTTPLGGNHEIKFNDSGEILSGETVDLTFTPAGPGVSQTVELDFSAMTQFADGGSLETNSDGMTANFSSVNGYEAGSLESFSFTETGDIVGSFSNGLTQIQGKIAMANFANPAGLSRQEGVFEATSNSGEAGIGEPAQGGFGSLAPSTLEMSNANLSQEFTNMITAQRGFQANSKLITTSDEMLQELVNLKR